jgi:outer membrane protein assembly factor BamB
MRVLPRKQRIVRWFGVVIASVTCATLLPAEFASGVSTSSALEFDAPSGLAFGGGHLWVTNEAGNSVSEINPSSGSWIATFNSKRYGFQSPTAITRDGAYLFVANASGSVSELRASDGALIRTISGSRYHFINPVAIEVAGSLILVLNAGRPSAAGVSVGSITEIRAHSGSFVQTVSGTSFAFADPTALAVSGTVVFVADKGDNSVTEVRIASGRLIRVVTQQGLNAPDGIAIENGNVWVADSGSNAATEINPATGTVITTVSDSDGSYGFGSPSMVIGIGGNVYVASPFGTSPMVTKLSATSGQPSWYMCNTNGPYYFSLLSAFAVSGSDLRVASRSGANSATPGAQTGSLTELSIGDGSLIATLPKPTTTTSSSTTTLP